jgi:hypothetical protein
MQPLGFHGFSFPIEVGIMIVSHDLILVRSLLLEGDRLSTLASALFFYKAIHEHFKGLVGYKRLSG